jgi:hypothetical protein
MKMRQTIPAAAIDVSGLQLDANLASGSQVLIRRVCSLRALFFLVVLVGFMMANCAASRSADLPVSGHMTCYAAYDCAFNASLGVGSRRKRKP